MFFNSNTIFMGMPINMALFGEKSLPYVLIYYIANTTFLWTFGVYEISLDNKKIKRKRKFKDKIKKIFSPALIGFIVAIIFTVLNIKLPKFILGLTRYFNTSDFPRKVFFIQASMPVMTNTSIIAEAYEVDGDYASLMIALTTIGSLIMIPLYIFFLTYVNN